jgi:hypothetical protein
MRTGPPCTDARRIDRAVEPPDPGSLIGPAARCSTPNRAGPAPVGVARFLCAKGSVAVPERKWLISERA